MRWSILANCDFIKSSELFFGHEIADVQLQQLVQADVPEATRGFVSRDSVLNEIPDIKTLQSNASLRFFLLLLLFINYLQLLIFIFWLHLTLSLLPLFVLIELGYNLPELGY